MGAACAKNRTEEMAAFVLAPRFAEAMETTATGLIGAQFRA
jgi:hypothetical protein